MRMLSGALSSSTLGSHLRRVWNPGIGHLLYRLYLLLSGNRTRLIATMIVFTSCGFMYDVLVMSIFRRPFSAFTLAFVFFGILVAINRYPS